MRETDGHVHRGLKDEVKGRGGARRQSLSQSVLRGNRVSQTDHPQDEFLHSCCTKTETLSYRRNAGVFHGVSHTSNTSRPAEINHTPCSDTHTPLMNKLEKKEDKRSVPELTDRRLVQTRWMDGRSAAAGCSWGLCAEVAEGVRRAADLRGLTLNRECLCAYLAALAGNAAVVVTCGLVATHHAWLILFEVAGDVP